MRAPSAAGTHSRTIAKQPRRSSSCACSHELRRVRVGPPLHAEAAQLVDRLRRQPEMSHDRHAGADDLPDHVLVAVDAFELDGVRAAPDEQRRRRSSPRAMPLRYERNGRSAITNLPPAARATARVCIAIRLERRRQRRLVPVNHHRRRVADENRVDVRSGDQARRPGVVGRDDRDLPAVPPWHRANSSTACISPRERRIDRHGTDRLRAR